MNLPSNIRLVIFDADGTLRRLKNGEDHRSPRTSDEWEVMPGVEEKIAELKEKKVRFGIASNQACVRRGEIAYVNAFGLLLKLAYDLFGKYTALSEANIRMCPHLPDTCVCRKPSPLMLFDIMRLYSIMPEDTIFIGDAQSDEKAAENAGCHFMHINQFLDKE